MQTTHVFVRSAALRLLIPAALLLGGLAVLSSPPALAVDCAVPSAYPTVQSAVNDANCTVIQVAAGTYTENVQIFRSVDQKLDIIGAGSNVTFVEGTGQDTVFRIGASTVNLSALTIRKGSTPFGFGGGIFSSGPLTLTDVDVSDNAALVGAGIFSNSNSLQLIRSRIFGNNAGFNGGGLFSNVSNSSITIVDSTISGNTASQGGGGIATFGGQIAVTLTRSTVSGNTASFGAGLFSLFGTLTLTNSTVSGNTAATNGGGLFVSSGNGTLTNSTIAANKASTGGGMLLVSSAVNLRNSLLSANTASNGANCFGSPPDSGYNLSSDSSCNLTATTSLSATDPLIGPLADNGGLTWTHALLQGSPAIDKIPSTACIVTEDQRGVSRPQGLRCDIGAYELLATTLTTAQQLQLLVDSGVLTQVQANVLSNLLDSAKASSNAGNTGAACNKLDAFINQVSALVRSGQLPSEDGNALIESVMAEQSQLGCQR